MSKKPEIIEREKRILKLLSEGIRPMDICNQIAKEFDVSPRTIERQYQNLSKELGENTEEARQEARLMTEAWLREAYLLAKEKEQPKGMIDAAKEYNRLKGVYDDHSNEVAPPKVIKIKQVDSSASLKVVGEPEDVD